MSRQKLENQAKNFLLEIDQEQEINEILSKDKKSKTGTQWIKNNNLIQQNQNFVGGWNGEIDQSNMNQNKIKLKNVKQYQQMTKNSRVQSANNDPEFLNPRYFSRNVSPQKKLNESDNIDFLQSISRKSSLSIQDLKKQQNRKLQRSLEYEKDDRDITEFEKAQFKRDQNGKDKLVKNSKILANICQNVNEKEEEDYDNQRNSKNNMTSYKNKYKYHRVYNIVKNKINMMSSPKQIDQTKLNLFEQVNSRHNSVFIPLNFTKKQKNNTPNNIQQLQFLNTINFSNPFKVNGETISEKIQQYIDENDKSIDVFKKINEVRRNSLLLQKNCYQNSTKQNIPEFIPIEQFPSQQMECQIIDQIPLEQSSIQMQSIELTERLQDEIKLKENYKRFLEQQNSLSQTPINKSRPLLTPKNNSSFCQNKSQIYQLSQNLESQQGSLQNTPNQARQYRLTPAETQRLFEHIEKQGRSYLSSSPTKLKNSKIKFNVQKKQNTIDQPTFSVTQSNFNKNLNILNQIHFDDDAVNPLNNMKYIILSKLSKQNNSNQIIDKSPKNSTAYSSLKKQRAFNNMSNENGLKQSLQNSPNNKLIQNKSQLFDSSILSRNNNSSFLIESHTNYPQNLINNTNRNSNSQNQCRAESYFMHKNELHSAPHRNRPKMNIQKINKVKLINFDLESTLGKQSPSQSFNHANSFEQNNSASICNTPIKQKNNKAQQKDKILEQSRVFFKQGSINRNSSGFRKKQKMQPNNQNCNNVIMNNSTPLTDSSFLEKSFQKWEDYKNMNYTSFQQNNSRLIEKNMQLQPKQIS